MRFTCSGVRSARLLPWQERLAALRELLLWDHALFLGLQIYKLATPPAAAEASQPITLTHSDPLVRPVGGCKQVVDIQYQTAQQNFGIVLNAASAPFCLLGLEGFKLTSWHSGRPDVAAL